LIKFRECVCVCALSHTNTQTHKHTYTLEQLLLQSVVIKRERQAGYIRILAKKATHIDTHTQIRTNQQQAEIVKEEKAL